MRIGFFDSGLGGLLILKAVVRALPQYDYIYYGDTANLPYGDKTEEEIFELTKAAITELFKRDCVLVIVACNTASAESLRLLQDTFVNDYYPDRRVLGVIIPTIEELLVKNPKRAVLIATKRTVESGKYEKELRKLRGDMEFFSKATPELVPLIESGKISEAAESATKTIDALAGEGDVVILGCTHYSLLKKQLRDYFGSKLIILSQDEIIPTKVEDYLSRHFEISSQLTDTGKREIVLTKYRTDYDVLTAEFLGGAYIPEDVS